MISILGGILVSKANEYTRNIRDATENAKHFPSNVRNCSGNSVVRSERIYEDLPKAIPKYRRRRIRSKIETQSVSKTLEKIKYYSVKNHITIAILNAELVLGKEHLLSAAEHALRAFEKKRNLSKHLETEILLYASGERQINEAIDKIGIKGNSERVALVVVGKADIPKMLSALHIERNDSVLEWSIEKKLSRFGFTESELKSVNTPGDLILERIALLVEKIS